MAKNKKSKKRKSASKNKAGNSMMSSPVLPVAIIGLGLFLWASSASATPTYTPPNGGGSNPTPGLPPAGGNGYTPVTGSPGSLNESYLGIPSNGRNRGIRNNNPGNEKRGSSPWNGKIPFSQSTDSTFEQFYTYPHGVRVTIYELKNNYINAGHNTVKKIMERYDQVGNTSYQNYVAGRLGVGINDILVADKPTLKKLVQAITRFENDQKLSTDPEVVTDAQFEAAWSIL